MSKVGLQASAASLTETEPDDPIAGEPLESPGACGPDPGVNDQPLEAGASLPERGQSEESPRPQGSASHLPSADASSSIGAQLLPPEPGVASSGTATDPAPEAPLPDEILSATEPDPPADSQVAALLPEHDAQAPSDGMEHFQRLRRRLLLSTLIATAAAVPLCWLLFDASAALSLLVGAVGGLLYLVLLARSVSRLGGERRSVSKVQLLVPVVLVLASSRLPQLELVPALVGFLLYKPALLVQAYLDR